MMRIAALGVGAILLLSGVAACSSSDDEAAGCKYDVTVGDVTVTGSNGAPAEITIAEDAEPVDELVIEDLCEGTGAEVTADSIITADYVGVAYSNGVQFDSSFERGEALTIPLNNLIQGWQEGLLGMQEGGSRLLVVPGELAYGEVSPGPGIGPNETLVFVLDMVAVTSVE